MTHDEDVSDSSSSDPGNPQWAGYWHVRRYGGEPPSVPTYYDATEESWDVIEGGENGLHVARHPILEIREDVIVLKDEGADDEEAETWRVELDGDRLYVRAETGPHEGAVGVADRTWTDPREVVS